MNSSTIIHIPHSSAAIPRRYLGAFSQAKLPHELGVMTDWFCDELFDCGRDRLVFPVSRLVCDVERFRDDGQEVMSRVGMGAVYRACSDLSPLRAVSEAEKRQILRRYYDVHHRRFTRAAARRLRRYGRCVIIDGHSFYPSALPYELCRDPARPDFCIGTSAYHTPEAISSALCALLRAKGFSVTCNAPFSGTIVPMRYFEKDSRVLSVMIEVNRRLYMDTPGVKNARFSEIAGVLRECVRTVEESAARC